MIKELSNFAMTIVLISILITIINMILPEGKNKKYVTFISGLIITIIMINPIISLLNIDIDIGEVFNQNNTIMANSEYKQKLEAKQKELISETYESNLKLDIISRLEEDGYKIKDISVEIDDKSYELNKINLNVEFYDGDIEPIVIDVSKNYSDSVSEYDKQKIKDKLNSIYMVDKNMININN